MADDAQTTDQTRDDARGATTGPAGEAPAQARQAGEPRKTATGKAAEIEALVEPTLESMGYRVVRTILTGDGDQQRLQVMVEPADGSIVDVEGCADCSQAIEAILDVEDPLPGGYNLEVSSPGMDRPLTRLSDYDRFAGCTAKVALVEPYEGRRRLKGELLGVVDGEVSMEVDGLEWRMGFHEIDKAKLVLTDEMLQQARKAAKQDEKRAKKARRAKG
jgi:ribosome maturation factor RimP